MLCGGMCACIFVYVWLNPIMFLAQDAVPPIKVGKICIRLEVKVQAEMLCMCEK